MRKNLYYLLSVIVLFVSCGPFNPLLTVSGNEDKRDSHYLGSISEDGFNSEYTYYRKQENYAPYNALKQEFSFVSNSENRRWLYEDVSNKSYGEKETPENQSSDFNIIFYEGLGWEYDVRFDRLLDPYGDNQGSGNIAIYAKFNSPERVSKIDKDGRTVIPHRYLFINEKGYLEYRIEFDDDVTVSTTMFAVKNLTMKGGDDFVINITNAAGTNDKDNKFYSFVPDPILNFEWDLLNNFTGFFAVIDNKFLDEANLYIDEGSNDWNGDEQDDIKPFTCHHFDTDLDTNTIITNAVAYSYGSQDSPDEFNKKMEDQKEFIKLYLEYRKYHSDPENPSEKYPELYEDWDYDYNEYYPYFPGDTVAPKKPDSISSTNYEYYVTPLDLKNEFNLSEYQIPGFIDDFSGIIVDEATAELLGNTMYHPGTYPVKNHRPYTPGYADQIKIYNNVSDVSWFYSGQSAGVDCLGFIMRSASYEGNKYDISDIGQHGDPWVWNDNDGAAGSSSEYVQGRVYLYDADNTVINNSKDDANLIHVTDYIDKELGKIQPGDIFYYQNSNGYHAGIICEVIHNSDRSIDERNELVESGDVRIIESTHSNLDDIGTIGHVINHRTLETYESGYFFRPWVIGRLMKEEQY